MKPQHRQRSSATAETTRVATEVVELRVGNLKWIAPWQVGGAS